MCRFIYKDDALFCIADRDTEIAVFDSGAIVSTYKADDSGIDDNIFSEAEGMKENRTFSCGLH